MKNKIHKLISTKCNLVVVHHWADGSTDEFPLPTCHLTKSMEQDIQDVIDIVGEEDHDIFYVSYPFRRKCSVMATRFATNTKLDTKRN